MDNKDRLKEVYMVLKEVILEYKLEFNSKTRIYKSSEGFEFLGINYYVFNNYCFYKNYFSYIR